MQGDVEVIVPDAVDGASEAAGGQHDLHRGAPPERGSPVSFSLLLNLVSAADASEKAILWGFLSRYIPGEIGRAHV